MDCDVRRPKYDIDSPCTREGQWSVISKDGQLRVLCSEHLGMFNTFGRSIVSWSRYGRDTTIGIQ